MKKFTILLLILLTTSVSANDNIGKVYFGKNLAKPFSEHTDRLYLKIDDSDKLFFNREYSGPVIDKLNLNTDHIVKVYFDDQVARSWKLNFSKINTHSVIIWRSAGSWRMEPADK